MIDLKTLSTRSIIKMKIVIALATPLFLLAACGEEASQYEVAIVAHRGAMHDYPENTIIAFQKAVDLGADIVEIDLRTSSDGHLFILHDAALDRTTSGTGEAGDYTLEELQQLDAGSWFAPDFTDERILSFPQVLQWASEADITLLLDLKESGHAFAVDIADDIKKYGVGENTVVGVRSAEQAREFRELLPVSKQLAFMGRPDEIEAFADAGADVIRLWLRWLDEDPALAQRVRQAGKKLMINGVDGGLKETRQILEFAPDWILIDDVVQLQRSLQEIHSVAEVQKPDKDDEFLHTFQIDSAEDLHDFFRYTGNDIPIVSGHRGGIVEGFPENSIEAFEHTLQHTHAIFEIDPRVTKDSVIVLVHDTTLDRTTTGTGNVSDFTWEELQQINLIDYLGNETVYKIPSLADVIEWSRGKTIINLDKKDVPLEMTAEIIQELEGESHVMVTVHSAAEARFYLDRNPDQMFSAFIRNEEELRDYQNEGIPWEQLIAYIGPRTDPDNLSLAEKLNDLGVMVMIGTAPSYDHLDSSEERSEAYRRLLEEGVNIIESDLPVEVGGSIQEHMLHDSPKGRYFRQYTSD